MSDLYDRCPHNERPSRCLACAHDEIERLTRKRDAALDLLKVMPDHGLSAYDLAVWRKRRAALFGLDSAASQPAAADKALRFDLDRAGIEQREAEAIELVELRAEVQRLRGLLRDEQQLALRDSPWKCTELECARYGQKVIAGDCACYTIKATDHRRAVRAALDGTAPQPEADHHDLCASNYWNYTHKAQAAMLAAGEWPPACNCRTTPDQQSESRDG